MGKIISGKSIKQWSEELGVTTSTVHYYLNVGTFNDIINNTYRRKRKLKKYEGLTVPEWMEKLELSESTVRKYAGLGILIKMASGAISPKPRGTYKTKRLINGESLTYWAKKLKITRERARQLANKGTLMDRANKECYGELHRTI